MKNIIILILLFCSGLAFGQTYGLDGLGTKFYQLEGCKKISNGVPCDSCFLMTRGLNGKVARCIHISELRNLMSSSGGGGLYGNDTVYLQNNSNGSYTLVNEAGTNYLFGYKFTQSGDTIFLTDQDGTKADTAILTGIGADGDEQKIDTLEISGDTLKISLERDAEKYKTVIIPNITIGLSDGNKNDITVTNSFQDWEIRNDSVNFYKIQQVASDRLIGRDSAGTGHISALTLGPTLQFNGTNSIDRAALTGDVTAPASSNVTTIAPHVVTFAKMQQVTGKVLIGQPNVGLADMQAVKLGTNLSFSNDTLNSANQTGTQTIDTFSIVNDSLRLSLSNDGQLYKKVSLLPYLDNTDDQKIDTFTISNDTIFLSLEGDSEFRHFIVLPSVPGTTNSIVLNGNIITSTVNGVSDTTVAILLLNANLSGNSITVNANGVTDTTLVIGSHTINYDGLNTITSQVNGVSDTCDISGLLDNTTNVISFSSTILTSTVNGVTDTALIGSSPTTNDIVTNGNVVSSTVNGVLDTTVSVTSHTITYDGATTLYSQTNGVIDTASLAGFLGGNTTNVLSLSGNTLTSNVNSISDTSLAVGSHTITENGNQLTSQVNGISDTTLVVRSNVLTYSDPVLTSTVNGVTDTAYVQINGSPFDKNGFYGGNSGNGGDGDIPDNTHSQVLSTRIYDLGYWTGCSDCTNGLRINSGQTELQSNDSLTATLQRIIVTPYSIDMYAGQANPFSRITLQTTDVVIKSTNGSSLTSIIKTEPDSITLTGDAAAHIVSPVIVLNDASGTGTGNANDVWTSDGYGGHWVPASSFTTNEILLSGNTITSTVNGVSDSTLAIGLNDLSSATNTMTSNINGVSDNATIINSITNGVSVNTLTTTVNGVPASTSVIVKDSIDFNSSNNTLTLNVNGITDTALLVFPTDKNGFYSGNGGNGGDGAIPDQTLSSLIRNRSYALGHFMSYPSDNISDLGFKRDANVTITNNDSLSTEHLYTRWEKNLINSKVYTSSDSLSFEIDKHGVHFFSTDHTDITDFDFDRDSIIMQSTNPIVISGNGLTLKDLRYATGEGTSGQNWTSQGIGNSGKWTTPSTIATSITLSGSLADSTYSGTTIAGTCGETLVFGDLCYLKSDGKWWKAKADVAATSTNKLSICVYGGVANDSRTFLLDGNVRKDSAFPTGTIGAVAYVSAATAGQIATTAPSGTTDFIVRLICYFNEGSGDQIYFHPSNDWISLN